MHHMDQFVYPGRLAGKIEKKYSRPACMNHLITLIVAHVGQTCIVDKSFYVTAPCCGMPSLETSERQPLTVQKDVKVSLFNQNTDLLCVYICIGFHLCALIRRVTNV